MTTWPKPTSPRKARKPMNKIGKVSKRRLAANKARKPLAEQIGRCEVGPILKARGITFRNCLGDLTWAHSRKHRGNDPVLEEEVARCCTLHHYYVLDLLPPAQTAEIVREAIRLRN